MEDDETIAAAKIVEGQTVMLVVDSDAEYWLQHKKLAIQWQQEVAKVHELMGAVMKNADAGPLAKANAKNLMQTCRRVLCLFLEKRATSKARSMLMLENVRAHLKRAMLPVLQASAQ